jgi:hypothetical protein
MDTETIESYTDDELKESVEVIMQSIQHYNKLLEDTSFTTEQRRLIELNHQYMEETLADIKREQKKRDIIEKEADALIIKDESKIDSKHTS